jgi:hypothetical protein
MHKAAVFRSLLTALRSALVEHGERFGVDAVELALRSSDADLEAFLVSNVLWGGAGSIADQAGSERLDRRPIEAVLIKLGEEQIGAGRVREEAGAFWGLPSAEISQRTTLMRSCVAYSYSLGR